MPDPAIRKYRLHLFDGDYELLTGETHAVAIDLDSPQGMSASQFVLADRLGALTRRATTAGLSVTHVRLEVRDFESGEKVLDWAGS